MDILQMSVVTNNNVLLIAFASTKSVAIFRRLVQSTAHDLCEHKRIKNVCAYVLTAFY